MVVRRPSLVTEENLPYRAEELLKAVRVEIAAEVVDDAADKEKASLHSGRSTSTGAHGF